MVVQTQVFPLKTEEASLREREGEGCAKHITGSASLILHSLNFPPNIPTCTQHTHTESRSECNFLDDGQHVCVTYMHFIIHIACIYIHLE